jgi:hypothetical protein
MQRLASDHRYAKAAVALLPSLARELGLARIEAPIEPENLASQAVCGALGFTQEGTLRSYLRIGGQNRDMIMFAQLITPAAPLITPAAMNEDASPSSAGGQAGGRATKLSAGPGDPVGNET